jgi:type I restriction-modification system DNA methylase subunit
LPLSWNEIRARSGRFATEWQGRGYEKGDTGQFYHQFFEVFGQKPKDVNIYFEKRVKLGDAAKGYIDLFWPGKLLVEQKSKGLSLAKARDQATDYYLALKAHERPRYILLSDFQSFELLDLETGIESAFLLSELSQNVGKFGFMAGYTQEAPRDQPEVNIEAATLMGNLHEQLKASGYGGIDLERLLVRLMFCLFADDTAIFNPDQFLHYIENKTSEDGRDLGSNLIHLFEILDTAPEKRQKNLDEDLAQFQHVNGKLFAGSIRTPSFDTTMRNALLQCCYFNWNKVSPALFGSLFQMVMLPVDQRKGGAHYTSERNILKTIHPLFLDGLREEFHKIRDSKSTQRQSQLEKFQTKLGTLTFFDPACGCGNFLILAYRELRLLELEVLLELYPDKQLVLDVKALSKVDVDQFYGIEIEEFPAHIAEAAMWLTDHQMNMQLSSAFGQALVRLPLVKSAHITHGNALIVDWKTVIAPEKLSYMLGNPPFVGKKEQSAQQKVEMKAVFNGFRGDGVLDYVTAWYLKAAQFIQGTKITVAFVSTNSITQGEQVAVLWHPLLTRYGIHISFAHRTFKWTIDEKKAKGMNIAKVHCVIIGFGNYKPTSFLMYDYEKPNSEPHSIDVKNINPYLVDATNAVIGKRLEPLCNVPAMIFGTKLVDDGHLVFSETEKNQLSSDYPNIAPYFRVLMGGEEFLNGTTRWCLWLVNADLKIIRNCPPLMERVEKVRKFRLASKKAPTVQLAKTPSIFGEIRQPDSDYLLVPKVSSEKRHYLPIGFCKKDIIASGSALVVPNATLFHFGVLTSTMHNAWMRQLCGRLESRYQYSASIVYNNFPWPQTISGAVEQDIVNKAQAILTAREAHPADTLADLYDPLTMPQDLLKAHHALDKAVDKAYRKQPFESDRQRLEYLFALYQQLDAPLDVAPKKAIRQKKKVGK